MIERVYGQPAIIDGIVLVQRGGSDYAINPTILDTDILISQDGGPLFQPETIPIATPSGSSMIRAVFTQAEMKCKRLVVRFISQSTPKLWEDQLLIIETFGHADAQRDIAGEVLDKIDGVESGLTMKQALRACVAILTGAVSGYPAGPGIFRAPDGITTRVTIVNDSSGNRIVVSLSL
mgnify:CR=1 FL=1